MRCTFTNARDRGTLKIKKIIQGNDGTTFDILVNGSTPPLLNDIGGVGTAGFVEFVVNTGAHTVTETLGNGDSVPASAWMQDFSQCNGGQPLQVAAGRTVECTITNSRKPKLTVTKNVVGRPSSSTSSTVSSSCSPRPAPSTSQTFTCRARQVSHPISETLAGGGPVGNAWDVAWAGDCAGAGHTVSARVG